MHLSFAILSPLLPSLDFLLMAFSPGRTVIIASDLDPCLDENVQFSSKLFEAGVEVKIEGQPTVGSVACIVVTNFLRAVVYVKIAICIF